MILHPGEELDIREFIKKLLLQEMSRVIDLLSKFTLFTNNPFAVSVIKNRLNKASLAIQEYDYIKMNEAYNLLSRCG